MIAELTVFLPTYIKKLFLKACEKVDYVFTMYCTLYMYLLNQ